MEITAVETFYEQGQRLSVNEFQSDGDSYRYAVVNIAGSGKAVKDQCREFELNMLGYRFEEVADDDYD